MDEYERLLEADARLRRQLARDHRRVTPEEYSELLTRYMADEQQGK